MSAAAAAADPPVLRRAGGEGSRERLLAAAAQAFGARGYVSVSVEDIAAAAGVSRMTFYRHFGGKAAVAAALFARNSAAAMPRLLAITAADTDRQAVTAWLADLFALDRSHRHLLRTFIQASVEDADFAEAAHAFIADLIDGLGTRIPAFAIDRGTPNGARRWAEAWLILYEILDQSNHAARGANIVAEPVLIDILADRLLRFITRD